MTAAKLKKFDIRWTEVEYYACEIEATDAEDASERFHNGDCIGTKSFDSEYRSGPEITEIEEVKDA